MANRTIYTSKWVALIHLTPNTKNSCLVMVKSMTAIDHPSGNSTKYHISFQPMLNSEDYKMNPIGGTIKHEITLSDIAGANVCKHPFSLRNSKI